MSEILFVSRVLVVLCALFLSCSGGDDTADDAGNGDADTDADTDSDTDSDSDAGAPDPDFEAEFVASDADRFYSFSDNGGGAAFGVSNGAAADGYVAELLFHGDPALGPDDSLSPAYATEIGTNDPFTYGEFRTRVQLAACASNEELVNGVFTYFNDGDDHDGDGLIDNSEIDIEILCSDPSILSLTIWSEYTSDDDGGNVHVTREIDTTTGDYWDTLNYTTDLGGGNSADFLLDGFPDADAFYEMGFDWSAGAVRYFLVFGGEEVTLWEFDDPAYIPSLPAYFLFNVWHSSDWWNEDGEGDYPANDAVMRVDWLRYWAH